MHRLQISKSATKTLYCLTKIIASPIVSPEVDEEVIVDEMIEDFDD